MAQNGLRALFIVLVIAFVAIACLPSPQGLDPTNVALLAIASLAISMGGRLRRTRPTGRSMVHRCDIMQPKSHL
jgi:hypothetical protein